MVLKKLYSWFWPTTSFPLFCTSKPTIPPGDFQFSFWETRETSQLGLLKFLTSESHPSPLVMQKKNTFLFQPEGKPSILQI